MKKILFGIICLILTLTLVEAKEYCEVVSGNGKDIGSEIACGDEHFYVIENDGTNTKMLAKYNLYVGLISNLVELDRPYSDYNEIEEYFYTNYQDLDLYDKEFVGKWSEDGLSFSYISIYYREYINPDSDEYGIQNELAIGAHGDKKGVSEYPVIGNIYVYEFEELLASKWNSSYE